RGSQAPEDMAGGWRTMEPFPQPWMTQRNMDKADIPFEDLAAALEDYRRQWPDESGCVDHFTALAADSVDPYVRERLAGHFTASSWLVSRDGTRTLLTHHRKLGLWV